MAYVRKNAKNRVLGVEKSRKATTDAVRAIEGLAGYGFTREQDELICISRRPTREDIRIAENTPSIDEDQDAEITFEEVMEVVRIPATHIGLGSWASDGCGLDWKAINDRMNCNSQLRIDATKRIDAILEVARGSK